MQLADSIASCKERETRRKIDKTKAATDPPSRGKHRGHSKGAFPSASDRLDAAKAHVVARKARHKREKARARKAVCQATQPGPAPTGDGAMDKLPSSSTTGKRKRVLFA